VATKEPTATPLGSMARFGTDDYRGLTLACLVAADRYQHLENEICPALRAGQLVLCDRYIASSMVLQRLDGVPPKFVWQLNQHIDQPDLCVILAGDPACARMRAEKRGLYSRFHRGGQTAGTAEAALYAAAVTELSQHGYAVLAYDTGNKPPADAAEEIASAIVARRRPQPDSS
jgi:dTMP kinase